MSHSLHHRTYSLFEGISTRSKPKKESDLFSDPSTFQKEYAELACGETYDEGREHVKELNVWHINNIKDYKSFDSTFKSSRSTKEYRQQKVQEGMGFPTVKVELIDRILADSDEEPALPVMRIKMADDEEGGLHLPMIKHGGRSARGSEGTILAYNEELIHDLVIKKIKEQVKPEEIERMGTTQLKLYIKAIAEDAIAHFKSLKGLLTPKLLKIYVSAALEIVREHKKGGEKTVRISKDLKDISSEEAPITNYDMNELVLIKEYENNAKIAKDLRPKITALSHEIFVIKKQKALYKEKLNQIQKEYKEIGKDMAFEGTISKTSKGNRKNHRRSAVADSETVVDHLLIKKLKDEKREQERSAQKIVNEIDAQLANLLMQSEQLEASLRAAKSRKTHCRIQLKTLYRDILKDEEALIKGVEETKSYAWVVRALWILGEEVREDALPSFLDSKACEFFMSYAKAQEEFENYCRLNNISNLLKNLRGLKSLDYLFRLFSDNKNVVRQGFDLSTAEAVGPFLEDESELSKPMRSLNIMISEYQEKAYALKKVNLKAKRIIHPTPSYGSLKTGSPKWEDVSSAEMGTTAPHHLSSCSNIDQQPTTRRQQYTDKSSIFKVCQNNRPLEKAMEMLQRLEEIKHEAIEKLSKSYMNKVIDDRIKSELQKIFRFIFGKTEGDQVVFRLIMDKKYHEEKLASKVKKVHSKHMPSTTMHPLISPKNLSGSQSQSQSQIFLSTARGTDTASARVKSIVLA